jgi:hypothetical protein
MTGTATLLAGGEVQVSPEMQRRAAWKAALSGLGPRATS